MWHPWAVHVPFVVLIPGVEEPSLCHALWYGLELNLCWRDRIPGANPGLEKDPLGRRAGCTMLGLTADRAAAAGSSWEAAQFPRCSFPACSPGGTLGDPSQLHLLQLLPSHPEEDEL